MPAEVETMFSGGNLAPWHGLGTVIPEDVVETERALQLAGLDWKVSLYPIEVTTEDGTEITTQPENPDETPQFRAVVRMSDHKIMGVVGNHYAPMQNVEAFDFMDDLARTKEAKWHTAGSLEGGKKVWGLARVPREVKIAGQDDETIEPYIFFATSHDGSIPITFAFTPVRIVCANTLTLALDSAVRTYKVRHTEGFQAKVSEARAALKLTHKYLDELEEVGNSWIRLPFSDKQFQVTLDEIIGLPELAKSETSKHHTEQERDMLGEIWKNSPNIQNITGTAWGAINAWAEFVDHHQRGRATAQSSWAENRMKRIVFSDSAKDDAYKLIGKMTKGESPKVAVTV